MTYSPEWYDREGRPLDMQSAGELLADFDYKVVKQTTIGAYRVSTVWLGLDHRYFGDGPPLIFETMVFLDSSFTDRENSPMREFDCERYSTEAEAVQGHEDMCTLVRATTFDDLPTESADHETRSPHE
jgi:hypothetical protein